jgi:hypothetical protein
MVGPFHGVTRRDVVAGSIVVGFLDADTTSAQLANASPINAFDYKVIITLAGAAYRYPDGPKIPWYYVDFREDGRIVFHLGALGDLTKSSPPPQPYHLSSHDVRIERAGIAVAVGTVPAHWWNAQWTYRPKSFAAAKTPAQIVAAHRMFAYGNTGMSLPPPRARVPYTVMGSSNIITYMPTTGERPDIGLVTDNSAYFMLGGDPSAMFDWALAAGSCPMHFRDESTGRPIDLSKYPQANAYDLPGLQGSPFLIKGPPDTRAPAYSEYGGGWHPQQAHFCEMSYLAHLATGDLGFLEDLQFSANFCVLTDASKSTPTGAIISGEQRGVGWALRELFMAHIATQDAEAAGRLPASCHPSLYWQALLDRARAYYDSYRTDPANQIFKLFASDKRFGPWQQDYCLAVLAFGLLTSHSEWRDIYLFALGNVIARTDGKSGYPPGWGGAYYLNTHEWSRNPDGSWNQNAFDLDKPLNWYSSFLFQKNDPGGPKLTQDEIDSLKSDPLNSGHAMTGFEYLMTTRAVLVMADYLDKNGLADVRKTYPDIDICLKNADQMVRSNGIINPRVSVV